MGPEKTGWLFQEAKKISSPESKKGNSSTEYEDMNIKAGQNMAGNEEGQGGKERKEDKEKPDINDLREKKPEEMKQTKLDHKKEGNKTNDQMFDKGSEQKDLTGQKEKLLIDNKDKDDRLKANKTDDQKHGKGSKPNKD